MVTPSTEAEWKGSSSYGSATMKSGNGAFEGRYSFKSRFKTGSLVNIPLLFDRCSARAEMKPYAMLFMELADKSPDFRARERGPHGQDARS